MNFTRMLRHLFTGHVAIKRVFSETALTAIGKAIENSEISHEGEIRFAVEAALNTPSLLRDQSGRERAVEVFSQLRVWDTEHNNGVLIYLLLADRNVEIIADRGINVRVKAEEWERICREMETAFAQGQFETGVIAGIDAIGRHLQEHFPTTTGGGENELPDRPIILKG
ncbi:TPM domain-containing protein [Nitrosovibrio tenuis]|uniref:TLP18.3, Psb32 and MOLO-1 founding protein of phosphatase n=1 Tax=Nitrosovibrio tenuis TaxID=1233 RepID=A0A1H7QBR7_9PROT|nr:TPM domain-containing protein [Nitrosovibrio tenuis]SEL45198.1 TLP18.3, Psb32 and MOLO-1 founding protein of phosphatase [Nitrosovibrio tenuis]